MRMLRYLSIAGLGMAVILIVDTPKDWDNYFMVLAFLFIFVWSFFEQKRALISDEEIDRILDANQTNGG